MWSKYLYSIVKCTVSDVSLLCIGIGSMVLSPTEQVQCHSTKRTSTSLPCEGNPIGNMSAEECCSNENGNSISTSNMCLGCLRKLILSYAIIHLICTFFL